MSRPHPSRSLRALFFLLCSLLLASSVTIEAMAADSEHIKKEIPQAHALGSGTFRWFGIAVYDAQLWVGKDGYTPEASGKLGQQPLALDLTYARSLVGSKIAEASIEEIQKLKLGTADQRKIWLEQMRKLFPDVKEGNHITGIFIPAEAARFYLNGKLLGEIKDADFANAFFSIWLDKKTTAPDLRQKLLAGSNG